MMYTTNFHKEVSKPSDRAVGQLVNIPMSNKMEESKNMKSGIQYQFQEKVEQTALPCMKQGERKGKVSCNQYGLTINHGANSPLWIECSTQA